MNWLRQILLWLRSFYVEKHEENNISNLYETPPWFKIAEQELGVKEYIPGDNPRIVEYHSATGLKAKDDATPWCASFVSWCLEKANVPSAKSAWARSYLKWGVPLAKPRIGCVVVFKRGVDSGHVAFYVSEDLHSITVLGGNQTDSVCIDDYSKDDLLGFRWPKDFKG